MKSLNFNLLFILVSFVLVLNTNPISAQTCTCDLHSLNCQCCVQFSIPAVGLESQFCGVLSFNVCAQTAQVQLNYNGNSILTSTLDVSQATVAVSYSVVICSGTFKLINIVVTDKYVQFTPAVSVCDGNPISSIQYDFPQQTLGNPSVCIGINNCADCTKQSACGWCNELSKCMDGDASGNFCKKCRLCGWNYGQCDNSQTCLAKSSACGFCTTNSLCIAGDPLGPAVGNCDLASWDYLTCAQRPSEFIPTPQAQHNYGVLGSSMFFTGLVLGVGGVFGAQFYKKGGFKRIHFSRPKFLSKSKPTTASGDFTTGYRRH